jgi:hypothetical protein
VPRGIQRPAARGDLAVHHARQAQDVSAGIGLRERHARVDLERRVVVDAAVGGEHAAVAVVGELVEAQVGLHRDAPRGGVSCGGDGAIEDACGVGGPAADGVAGRGHPEEHDAADARRDGLFDDARNGVERVLRHSRHARNGLRGVDPLFDENGQDEPAGGQIVLGDEVAQHRAPAQATRTADGERGHGVPSWPPFVAAAAMWVSRPAPADSPAASASRWLIRYSA